MHETTLRVRYAETDQMGYVYYGNYGAYLEVARTEMLRSLGFIYKDLEAQGILLPVRECNIKYLKPVRYDDLITIKTTLTKLLNSSMELNYQLFNAQDELLTQCYTKLVFWDKATQKLCVPPAKLLAALAQYFS